ncbi:MAG TPA: hypothetical protein VHJ83_01450, partial [Micromonosporaceae bacterium]|nr:hypothetical protein [Micromonosporaceae bacterium]
MLKRAAAGVVAAIAAVFLTLGIGASPAFASTFYTGGTATSIWNWTTGSTQYVQNHYGDDFGFDVTSGIAVDMRWMKCTDSSVYGTTKYNITPSEGRRTLGTDFLAT